MKTNQQIFNFVVTKLMEQGRQSENAGHTCMYRETREADCPIRCAVGHCIPNSAYNPRMEMMTIDKVIDKFPYLLNQLEMTIEQVLGLVMSLQHVHDIAGVELWPIRFCQVANRYNLNTDVLNKYLDKTANIV